MYIDVINSERTIDFAIIRGQSGKVGLALDENCDIPALITTLQEFIQRAENCTDPKEMHNATR